MKKILGVWLDDKLSFKEHVYEIVKKSGRVGALILNNIKNLDNNMLIKLYKCFVRLVLECTSVAFSPHHISLIDLIENMQRLQKDCMACIIFVMLIDLNYVI